MDHYINMMILNYNGYPKHAVIPIIKYIREEYRGRICLINDDPTVDSCEWGRRYFVDYHTTSVARVQEYLARSLDEHRKRGKTPTVRLNEVAQVLVGLPESVDATEEIEQMLEHLTDDQRSLIYMKHVGGLRCREIAEQTGKPLGTVTAALSRAYKSLRASLSTSRSTSSHRGGGS